MKCLVETLLVAALATSCAAPTIPPVSTTTPSSAYVPGAEPAVVRAVHDSPDVLALLASPERSAADRALDAPRRTADLLTYLDVRPGMNVAQLAAGAGYMTDLLARSVGPRGRLFAENPPSLVAVRGLEQAWEARLAEPIEARVVQLKAELEAPLPSHVLDLVYIGDDLGDLGSERTKVGAAAASAWYMLRVGGRLALVQRDGDTAARDAIEGVGFRPLSEGRFWDDGTMVVTFVKP